MTLTGADVLARRGITAEPGPVPSGHRFPDGAHLRIEIPSVEGPGVLHALGSANPTGQEGFAGPTCTTFDGHALAVVRPTGEGKIIVTASADGCEPRHVRVDAAA